MYWPSIREYFSVTVDKMSRLKCINDLGEKITHEAPAADKLKHHKIIKTAELPKLAGTLTANISQRQRPCVCVDSICNCKGLSSDLELISVG